MTNDSFQPQDQRPLTLLLTAHASLNDRLHLQRVGHTEKRRRTQAERSTFRISCEGYAVALGVCIGECRWHIRGHCLYCFLLLARQIVCRAGNPVSKRLHERTEVVIEDRRKVSVSVCG